MDRDTASWLIPVLLAAAVCGGLWYYWVNVAGQKAGGPETAPATGSETLSDESPLGPLHPLPAVEFSDGSGDELRELPSLSDSDEYFKLELSGLFGEPVGNLLVSSRIIERVVATVDNLPRDHVAERIRPLTALSGPFAADPEGGDLYTMSAESFQRYDSLVSIVANANVAELADLYRRYYPLFQKAYVDLGYPNGYFNDRLVEAIDDMLAAPELDESPILIRPHVMYEFEDPDLESRSSGQKLLLRMGGDNAAMVKSTLRSIRDEIVDESPGA